MYVKKSVLLLMLKCICISIVYVCVYVFVCGLGITGHQQAMITCACTAIHVDIKLKKMFRNCLFNIYTVSFRLNAV